MFVNFKTDEIEPELPTCQTLRPGAGERNNGQPLPPPCRDYIPEQVLRKAQILDGWMLKSGRSPGIPYNVKDVRLPVFHSKWPP